MKQAQTQRVSIFDNTTVSTCKQITIEEYFNGILTGRWQDAVLEYRTGKRTKQNIPAVTVSGMFSGRKDSDLVEHSGLLVIDIDEKDQTIPISDIKSHLKEIPEIFAIHSSLGGKGIAAYFRINKAKHRASFDEITKMLVNDYSVMPDMHCSNIGRLRFVSYDPGLYLNYGASAWSYFEKNENKTNENTYSNHIFSENDVEYILQQITERHINIAPDYYSWVRIGFGLASKFGDAGREYFEIISNYHGKQKISPSKQYDHCLASEKRNPGVISIKSFFYYAKIAGCNITSDRTKKITTVGKVRRKQEQSAGSGSLINGRADAKKYLEEFENISGKDVDDILDQVWKTPIKDLVDEEGLIYDIEVFLRSNYKFRINEITSVVEVDGVPISDYIFNTIYLRVQKIVSEKAAKDKVFDLIHSDFTNKYNPLAEWFSKNKHLKPSGNIDKLAKCISSELSKRDATFVRHFLEKWLLSVVASAHGTYSILCLVLSGDEHGTGKTNFFRNILPPELKWLFSINKLDGKEADVGQLMCTKLIILDDEFGGKSKQDEKRFKELISKDVFSIRKPYGRYFEDMQRLAVLCGTTNDDKIISDLTGNRRIIPIQVNHIDLDAYEKIDKTELFAELYLKYRENPTGWFLNKEDIRRLNEVCFDSQQVTAEMELPLIYFENCTKGAVGARFLSSSEIRSVIEKRSGIRLSQQKLSIALKNLGFEGERARIGGAQMRGFWVKQIGETVEFVNTNDNSNTDESKLPF